MNKPTKYRKINEAEYKALIPAMHAFREAFKSFMGVGFSYNRVFTEKRAYGARTKFWYTFGLSPVSNYIAQHPTIVVNGITYEVSAKWVYRRSLSLYFKAISN